MGTQLFSVGWSVWRGQRVKESETLNTERQCPTLTQPKQISQLLNIITFGEKVKRCCSGCSYISRSNNRAVWNWPQNMHVSLKSVCVCFCFCLYWCVWVQKSWKNCFYLHTALNTNTTFYSFNIISVNKTWYKHLIFLNI